MKKLITLLLFYYFTNISFSQTPSFQGVFNNSTGTVSNQINSIAKDANGNSFFCGGHTDTLKFGSTILLPGQGGAFWGKADAAGNILWLKQGGTTLSQSDKSLGISVDQNGDVYVCGAIAGHLIASFNGTPLSTMYPGFVVKYSNSGNFIWATGIGSNVFAIAVDNNNYPVINQGDQNVYKLDPNTGAEISSPSGSISGNLQNPSLHNIKIDASNNIIVQAGNKIVKFDNSFSQLWSTPITSSLSETFQINLDQNGNVFGSFYALFGMVTVGTVTKSNFPNGYIYKLDAATGNPVFVDSILISSFASKIREVIVENGFYYISGDGAFNTPVILKMAPDYSVIWSKPLNNKSAVKDIYFDSEDCIKLGGSYSGSGTLDSYTLELPNGSTNIDNSFFASLCTGTVGAKEINESMDEILIFPNPASEAISIIKNNSQERLNYYIIDQLGKTVASGTLLNSNNKISIANLNAGLYFVKIYGETTTTFKLVRN